MKRSIIALSLALLTVGFATTAGAPPAKADASFSFYYSNLGRYGDWEFSAEYGEVWCPRVRDARWHPYRDGRWAYTDLGWAWVSDYSWGAIPYHYGTWTIDRHLGWVWIPGYVWAPSWVVFSTGSDYIGWAPVSPSFSVGIDFGTPDADAFVYVPARQFLSSRLRSYVIPGNRARGIVGRTRVVNQIRIENDIVVNRGPDPRYVEERVNRRVRPERIERISRATPERRFERSTIRVDRRRHGDSPRVAEPRHERQQPQNDRNRGKAKRGKGRGHDHDGDR